MLGHLLHGRLLTAPPPPSGVIAAPKYEVLRAFKSSRPSAQAEAVFTLKPDGIWTGTGTGYQQSSGTWHDPVVAGAGDDYEVRITAIRTSGTTGVVANEADDFVVMTQERTLEIMVQRFTDGTSIASYNVKVEIRPAGGAVVSIASFDLSVTAEVPPPPPPGGGGGGGGCPALGMWLGTCLLAGEVAAGQKIDGVTTDEPGTLARLPVLADQISLQPCYRIVARNGAACVLSDSTPFTLRDGSSRMAPGMLGQQVLRDDGLGGLVWDLVVACYPVGMQEVIKISVGGHSLLAGENPLMRIVSHNAEKL